MWQQICKSLRTGLVTEAPPRLPQPVATGSEETDGEVSRLAAELDAKARRLFGHSLHIRHVDAGSCNGCDFEMTALLNPVYDIQRFGFDFVASPRHADLLMVTGPVTHNLRLALLRTLEATPEPRLVMALGTCAVDGGIAAGSYAAAGGVNQVVPVDIYVPGCPPSPADIIRALLSALDRLDGRKTG